MSDTAVAGLSPAELETFHREGWLMLPELVRPADLEALCNEVQREIHDRATQLVADGKLSRTYEDEGFTTRLSRITAETEALYYALVGGQYCGPEMFELLRHPRILAVVESLVGPEIVASSAFRLRPKVPGLDHGVVPWHQDSGYFEPACDDALVLTIWMPLVDATPDNGCLWVIPGVHQGPVVEHYQRPQYLAITDGQLDLDQAVCVPVPKGGALLLTNRTPHCSTENHTDVIRWSVDLRYQGAAAPSPAWPEPLRTQAIAATQARTELPELPLACYMPEADFLVHSRRYPQSVVNDWERFYAIRTQHQPGPAPRRWAAPA